MASDKGIGFRLDTRFGVAVARPGGHHVRIRAYLTFGGSNRSAWTEVRDLPELYFGIYDIRSASPGDARIFVYSPATRSARELDPLLPDQPLAVWLADVLGPRDNAQPPPEWISRYCSERTADPGSPAEPVAICSVLMFGAGSRIAEIWFRTGEVRVNDDRIDWAPAPPTVEAILVGESELESPRLSMLAALLDRDPADRPVADVSISADDIVVTPGVPKPGVPARAVVTVHNRGMAGLHKLLVTIVYATGPKDRGTFHNFVVDIPAFGSTELSVDVLFPRGYGIVMAQAFPVTEHAPRAVSDPTPDDACAFRIVNPSAAPSGLRASLGDMSGCPGR